MTKASKVLTIALLIFSVSFFAAAGLNVVLDKDWKKEAESFTSKITEQQKQNEAAMKRIEVVEPLIKDAEAANAADLIAIEAAVAELKTQLTARQEKLNSLSGQLVELVRNTTEVRKVAIQRREEVEKLQSQFGELRAQKEQVLAESRRLTDLLYQAQGSLDRITTRKQLLEMDGAKAADTSTAKP